MHGTISRLYRLGRNKVLFPSPRQNAPHLQALRTITLGSMNLSLPSPRRSFTGPPQEKLRTASRRIADSPQATLQYLKVVPAHTFRRDRPGPPRSL